MDIRIYDNFEDDGQLTLFGLEEDFEELQASAEEQVSKESLSAGAPSGEHPSGEPVSGEHPIPGEHFPGQESNGIRIRSCSSCGKLLFVREEDGGYVSACNACGIQYIQK